jgi:hypothetical protein
MGRRSQYGKGFDIDQSPENSQNIEAKNETNSFSS